jgi:hypothetical protein
MNHGKMFYTNIDSLYFSMPRDSSLSLQFGNLPGQFKFEVSNVRKFLSVAPRSYFLTYENSDDGLEYQIVKSCGLSFAKLYVSNQLTAETFGEIIEKYLAGIVQKHTVLQPRKKRRGNVTYTILAPFTMQQKWFNNRVLLKDESGNHFTRPFGFTSNK